MLYEGKLLEGFFSSYVRSFIHQCRLYVLPKQMIVFVSSAKDSYVYKTYLKDDAIKTMSNDGVVTLTGTVSEDSHKSLAQNTVENLPGVKSVDNQLTINGQQPAENSDGWLSMKVKGALLFNRNVSAVNTEVYVTDGSCYFKRPCR